jgi:hypothetical protein
LKNINLNIKIDIKKCYNFGGMFSQKWWFPWFP